MHLEGKVGRPQKLKITNDNNEIEVVLSKINIIFYLEIVI